MKITVLGSGSKGNAAYFESNGVSFLIDSGLSYKQMKLRLSSHNRTLDRIKGIFITHEHSDHVKGLNVLLKKTNATCFITEKTFQELHYKIKDNIHPAKLQLFEVGQSIYLDHILLTPIRVSHDATDTVGYVIEAEQKKIVYMTDIGYLPKQDQNKIKNAHCYIFESNYDVTKLFTSKRPFYLKQRIDSVKGHMSNTDSAYNLTQLIGLNTSQIILAHPSRECNTKELALSTHKKVFMDYDLAIEDYNMIVATQDIPTPLIEI